MRFGESLTGHCCGASWFQRAVIGAVCGRCGKQIIRRAPNPRSIWSRGDRRVTGSRSSFRCSAKCANWLTSMMTQDCPWPMATPPSPAPTPRFTHPHPHPHPQPHPHPHPHNTTTPTSTSTPIHTHTHTHTQTRRGQGMQEDLVPCALARAHGRASHIIPLFCLRICRRAITRERHSVQRAEVWHRGPHHIVSVMFQPFVPICGCFSLVVRSIGMSHHRDIGACRGSGHM